VPEPILYSHVASPLGAVLLVSNGAALTTVHLPSPGSDLEPGEGWRRDDALLRPVCEQVRAYFDGELLDFDVPLAPSGTAFQRRVWDELRRIPYGATVSYAEVARRLGQPTAARAVGAANRCNPIAVIVPCHRVIGADGTLTGYAGGLEYKRWLLQHERAVLERRTAGEARTAVAGCRS
jgi:methylated-DNA-[protein]-cysteine S-methyltransferase